MFPKWVPYSIPDEGPGFPEKALNPGNPKYKNQLGF